MDPGAVAPPLPGADTTVRITKHTIQVTDVNLGRVQGGRMAKG